MTYSVVDDGIPIDDGLWFPCPYCGGDGLVNRYEEDPLWYGEDEWFICEVCRGDGGTLVPWEREWGGL